MARDAGAICGPGCGPRKPFLLPGIEIIRGQLRIPVLAKRRGRKNHKHHSQARQHSAAVITQPGIMFTKCSGRHMACEKIGLTLQRKCGSRGLLARVHVCWMLHLCIPERGLKARDSLENVSGNSLTMGPLKTQLYSNRSYQHFDCFFKANRAEDVGSV